MQYDKCPRCNVDLDAEHLKIMREARKVKAIYGDALNDIRLRDYYCVPCFNATIDEDVNGL